MKSLYAHIWGVKAKAVLRVEILVLLGVSNILGYICKRRNNRLMMLTMKSLVLVQLSQQSGPGPGL